MTPEEEALEKAKKAEEVKKTESDSMIAKLVEILGTKSKSSTDGAKEEPKTDIRKEIRDSLRIERALVDVPAELTAVVEAAVEGKSADEALKIIAIIKGLDIKKKAPVDPKESSTGDTGYKGMFSKDYKPAWQKELDKKNENLYK